MRSNSSKSLATQWPRKLSAAQRDKIFKAIHENLLLSNKKN